MLQGKSFFLVLVVCAVILLWAFSFPGPRVFDVNVAVDGAYIKNNPKWEEEIIWIMRTVSKNFEALPKPITFRIQQVVLWQPENPSASVNSLKEMGQLVEQLSDVSFKNRSHIVMGFTGIETPAAGMVDEVLVGNKALVTKKHGRLKTKYTAEEQSKLVTHEIGHLFGAREAYGENSFMDMAESTAADRFDLRNIEIIMKNLERTFRLSH